MKKPSGAGRSRSASEAKPRRNTGGKPKTSRRETNNADIKSSDLHKKNKTARAAAPHKSGATKPGFSKTRPSKTGTDKPRTGARPKRPAHTETDKSKGIRLNRFLANTGICSRRQADEYILAGVVKVNGEIITELGTKVMPGDTVHFGDRKVTGEPPVYVLLNKPKDFITTTKDPRNRKTVMELVKDASPHRVYPVGRLDRNTTGVLLLTNDGELARKLTHPSSNVEKIYHVTLDQKFTSADMEQLRNGLKLDDGFIQPDEVDWVAGQDRTHVGIRLHSGKNRIVRRMFEHLGYKVIKLDRVLFAGLTKKGLSRGEYRLLTDSEINLLKRL